VVPDNPGRPIQVNKLIMKTISITRVLTGVKGVVRDRLIRLEGDLTLSSLMSSYG
jgi:hypothetical protein